MKKKLNNLWIRGILWGEGIRTRDQEKRKLKDIPAEDITEFTSGLVQTILVGNDNQELKVGSGD